MIAEFFNDIITDNTFFFKPDEVRDWADDLIGRAWDALDRAGFPQITWDLAAKEIVKLTGNELTAQILDITNRVALIRLEKTSHEAASFKAA